MVLVYAHMLLWSRKAVMEILVSLTQVLNYLKHLILTLIYFLRLYLLYLTVIPTEHLPCEFVNVLGFDLWKYMGFYVCRRREMDEFEELQRRERDCLKKVEEQTAKVHQAHRLHHLLSTKQVGVQQQNHVHRWQMSRLVLAACRVIILHNIIMDV